MMTNSETENIKLSAKEGVFEKMSKASFIWKCRDLKMSDITFKTESIEWNNRTETEPARIWTHGKIELQGTDVHLNALLC
jgi:hypothetical protein